MFDLNEERVIKEQEKGVLRMEKAVWQKELIRDLVGDEPKAFAYDIGVSLTTLYNYMNGRLPSTEILFRIARYTGRPMEDFLRSPQVQTAELRRVG